MFDHAGDCDQSLISCPDPHYPTTLVLWWQVPNKPILLPLDLCVGFGAWRTSVLYRQDIWLAGIHVLRRGPPTEVQGAGWHRTED